MLRATGRPLLDLRSRWMAGAGLELPMVQTYYIREQMAHSHAGLVPACGDIAILLCNRHAIERAGSGRQAGRIGSERIRRVLRKTFGYGLSIHSL